MGPLQAAQGYRSAVAYWFREEQADDITRVAAYHRKDYDLAVIWFSASEHVLIRASIATSFGRTSNHGLGVLERLPLEVLYDVVLRLDMQSLFKLRQTNLRARQIVDSLKEYRLVVSHGLNVFCALLRTGIATGVSLSDFYNALCTENCSICGEFSGFVSLPAWTRCCFACLQKAPETQVRSLARVRKRFRLRKRELDTLRPFKTLVGFYSRRETKYRRRTTAVSLQQAMLLSEQEPEEQGQARSAESWQALNYNFMGSCALPYYDKRTGQVEQGVCCAGCQLAFEKGIIGARTEKWASEARDKVYSRAGFLEHFKWCEQAQLLWRTSEEGTRLPAELPVSAWMGGHFLRLADLTEWDWNGKSVTLQDSQG
ncbi:hypothetical protein C8A03DRAFT_34137 [Achaetomium macrosporum]|uniref:F-box domain-containing protein n=1 Tax=Achaetomium macrosporum TaxID=79813 RepID=A0AAN7CBE0_9PEZI|nr:hypothetical protein C8A03DRAFT_34137 [Achaetomium macrosporum]